MKRTFIIAILLVVLPCFGKAPSAERVEEIFQQVKSLDKDALKKDVEIEENQALPFPAGCKSLPSGKNRIVYNPMLISDKHLMRFILMHELGHIHLGHTKQSYRDMSHSDKIKFEFEADTFALFAYIKFWHAERVQEIINKVRHFPSEPSGLDRYNHWNSILQSRNCHLLLTDK